ncbi:pyridoxal-phosphate dependent enzyme [Nocardia sp. NEAU-351]|uniref:Pyridoxal-phosphate dependent enzyme n=1 Tax=Nocardia bovistercoris TaxID=2785916 RepID=A0A931N5U3_9NOCA|nr:pyridoxal-phosphate dependent enzyme [Nocardia bovistercoris]
MRGRPDLLRLIGATPVVALPAGLGLDYLAKLESHGVGGMKARAAVAMLTAAIGRGELAPEAPVIESTSGTLGVGLALAGKALGHPTVLVVDDALEPEMRALFAAYGVRLEVVTRPHPVGGWQQARLDRLAELLAATPGAYWPDQYNNPDNARGYAGMALEIVRQVESVDVLVVSVGTGGHSAGLAAALRPHWPRLRIIGVDSVGSRIFGQPARARLMRGLGSSILPRNVAYATFDEVHWVGPTEAAASCRELAGATTIAGGWSTGATALVAAWAARREPSARVLTVFPDGPMRYLRTIYDDRWCAEQGIDGAPVTHPVEIGSSERVEVRGWARCRAVADPRTCEVPA